MLDRAFIESYYATYNSGNPAALREFYADDVVLSSAQGDLHGPEAILDTYRYITSQLQDHMTPTRIDIDGDRAVVEITDVFTARADVADFMGATLRKGEKLELLLRGTYRVENGRFKRIVIEMRG
jgi:ketosteroid isomerase-like protein